MIKRILIAALFAPLLALAQSYPSPTFQNLTINGTLSNANVAITGGSISGISPPIPVASGGTGAATASGTALDNITGFAGTGFMSRAGAGSYTFSSRINLTNLANQAANTVVANITSGSATPTAFAMPSCSTSSSAINYTTNTGFGCNSSINAATLGGATFAAPGPIGSTTASTGAFTTLSASAGQRVTNTSGSIPLTVTSPASDSVAANFIGTGSSGSLSSYPLWTTYTDYSTSHSVGFDVQAVNSAGTLKDQAVYINPGFQWWDSGHEESDIDFNGYVNGTSTIMFYMTAGCLPSFNNNGNGVACTSGIAPNFGPGTSGAFDLGSPVYKWWHGYFSSFVFEEGRVVQGTKPTLSGTCTAGSQVGGATAGQFTATANCTAGTYILTFPEGSTNAWACSASDISKPGNTTYYVAQSSLSSTSVTFTANTLSGDAINFQCTGY